MPNYLAKEVKSRARPRRMATASKKPKGWVRSAVEKRKTRLGEELGTKKETKLGRYKREAKGLKKKAKYLGSPRGLATETLKGLPAAARKIAGRIAGGFRRRF